jgi:putative flippase GtrA
MPPFVRFLLVGLANTAVGYGVILIFQYVFSAGYMVSNACGYAIGALVSYFFNKSFTFKNTRAHGDALPRFLLAVTSAYLINLAALKIAISLLQLPAAIAQGAAILAYTVCFYVISKHFVFRNQPKGS